MAARRAVIPQVQSALGRVGLLRRGRRPSAASRERHLIRYASHALLSPLTACRWQLELLDGNPDERREVIAVVTDELRRMETILLDLGVLTDAGEPDFLCLERFDLELFAHELVAEASARAERAWMLDGAEGSMLGDSHRLGDAVLTLADVAVEHTRPGDVLAIGARAVDDEVRLWVRATGRGIEPEEQARVTERLTRGVEAWPRYDERGLGLAVVGAIVEAHGGHVELESRRDEGSVFTIVASARPDSWARLLPGSHPRP